MSGAPPVRTVPRVRATAPVRPALRAGHEVWLLEGGAAFFPALVAAIDAARAEIHLETYIVHDDHSARPVFEALARAAARGVLVQVAVDGFGTPRVPPRLAALLAAGPAQLRVFRPEHSPYALDRRRLRRLHRKIAVIDRELAFIGGINLLDDHVDPAHGALDRPRLDFAVRVRGPLVDDALLAARQLWASLLPVRERAAARWPCVTGRRARAVSAASAGAAARASSAPSGAPVPPVASALWNSPALPPASPPASPPAHAAFAPVRAMLLLRDNFRFRRAIEHEYLQAIGSARHRVLIANAYFFPGARLRRALILAVRRGVPVTLLLQGRVEYALQHYASQALYDELLAAGVRIVEYASSFMHAKVAVADDWATVGSSNIDPFSLLLAREANVVVRDAGFAAHLAERIHAAIAQGGREVHPARHARGPLRLRAVRWAAFALLRAGVALSGRASRW
jgi:cardiolipin synthase